MASSPAAESPMPNAAPATPAPVVGFQTKKPAGMQAASAAAAAAATGASSTPSVTPERMAYLEATLAKLPELDLSEMARVKTCFASVLGEGRENIVNGLELRVVLGDLGLYPSEEELKLVLRAYRDRVNLVGLARYLRLYKKEFWLNQVAARSNAQHKLQSQQLQQQQQQQQQAITGGGGGAGGVNAKRQLGNGNNNNNNNTGTVIPHTYTAFSGSHARPGGASGGHDEDSLRAFVALGGEEDGSGEIAAATLREAVRGFGLTIDIDAMIRTVDVHHSGMLDYVDFCALWAAPADAHQSSSESMGHAMRQASAEAERGGSVNANNNNANNGGGSPFPMTGANRRLLSVLMTPSHRSSLTAGALQRRSYLMASGYDMTGLSQPITPSAVGGHGRRPTSQDGLHGNGGGGGGADGAVTLAAAPLMAAAVPAPITEDEHALLVRMFLFPEQFEGLASTASRTAASSADGTAGRRGGTRFMIPSRMAQVTSPSHAGSAMNNNGQGSTNGNGAAPGSTTAAGAAAARRASLSQRNQTQKQLAQSGRSGQHNKNNSTRSTSRQRRNNNNSSRGRKSNNNNNNAHGSGDDDDDLAADFFSPKNQNVYRPPSPMLLSMRNSTAYRNRVKRLEEQKHAARGTTSGSNHNNNTLNGGLHAATVARDGGAGGYGYGADGGDSGARPSKGATW